MIPPDDPPAASAPADASEGSVDVGALPLPEWKVGPSRVGFGVDIGALATGVRVRFRIGGTKVDHIDVRVAGSVAIEPWGVQPVLLTGGEVVFTTPGPIRPMLSTDLGAAFVGLGGGVQYDPPGPFELHAGAVVGVGWTIGVIPDVSVTWVW